MSQNIPKRPNMSQNVPKRPKTSQNIQKCPKMSQNVPKWPKTSLHVPKRPKMSQNIQRCQKTSQNMMVMTIASRALLGLVSFFFSAKLPLCEAQKHIFGKDDNLLTFLHKIWWWSWFFLSPKKILTPNFLFDPNFF